MREDFTIRTRTTPDFFSKQFSKFLDQWKKKTGKTQEEFAKFACSNKNSISNYKRGQIPNDETISCIIKVFKEDGIKVTKEDFIPHDPEDVYRHNELYIRNIIEHNRDIAKEIGLSEGFVDFLINKTQFQDPEYGYTVWSPLYPKANHIVPSSGFETKEKSLKHFEGYYVTEYGRLPLADTQAVRDDQLYTVRNREGTSFVLSEIDLRILKDLQNRVVKVMDYFYHKRKLEMESQEVEATIQANGFKEDGGFYSRRLQKEELISIDEYTKYLKYEDEKGEE